MIEAKMMEAKGTMSSRSMRAALAGLAAALAVLCSSPAMAQREQGIAVLVNDEAISSYDVQQRARLITVTTGQKNSERVRNRAIDELIDEKLMMQEAKRLNIEVPQDVVQGQLEQIARSSKMNVKQLAAALRSAGININAFTQRIEAQVAWSLVVRNRFGQSVQMRPEEVESALANIEGPKITSRYEYELQNVLFIVPNGASNATVSAQRNMAERFRRGFSSCAEARSQVAGLPDVVIGDLTERSSDAMSQAEQERFAKLKANQATAPQRTSGGFEVIAVCAKTEIKDEAVARRTAERQLLNEELQVRARRHLHDLKRDAVIERR